MKVERKGRLTNISGAGGWSKGDKGLQTSTRQAKRLTQLCQVECLRRMAMDGLTRFWLGNKFLVYLLHITLENLAAGHDQDQSDKGNVARGEKVGRKKIQLGMVEARLTTQNSKSLQLFKHQTKNFLSIVQVQGRIKVYIGAYMTPKLIQYS